MKITDFLDASRIIPNLQSKDKRAVLREMAEKMASQDPAVNADKLLTVLLEREKISSTAIGEGVAIPHGKMPGISKVSGIFARSPQGVSFDSLDGGLTYLFFLLVAPENSIYLSYLRQITLSNTRRSESLRLRWRSGSPRRTNCFASVESGRTLRSG